MWILWVVIFILISAAVGLIACCRKPDVMQRFCKNSTVVQPPMWEEVHSLRPDPRPAPPFVLAASMVPALPEEVASSWVEGVDYLIQSRTPRLCQVEEAVPEVLPVPEPTFSVLCYNIRCDVDRSPHDWQSRRRHVLVNIARHNPGIVCLQESTSQVQQYLCQHLDGSYVAVGSVRDDSHRAEAAHILVDKNRWGILSQKTFVFTGNDPVVCETSACTSDTVFGGIRAKHVRVFTHVRLQGYRVVNVINTHFPLDDVLQQACARQLSTYVASLTDPVIVVGDFNSHYAPTAPDTPLQLLMTGAGLTDTNQLVDSSTFGSFSAVDHTVHKLDYILVKEQPGLALVNSSIVGFTYGPSRFRPSDHEALIARFVMN